MTDLLKLYWNFLSKAIPFGGGFLKAFPETTVDKDEPLPYLTYSVSKGDFLQPTLNVIRIWTRSTNLMQLAGFTDSLDKAIPHGGVRLFLPDNKGGVYIVRGNPWTQPQPMDEADIRVSYSNVIIQSFIL